MSQLVLARGRTYRSSIFRKFMPNVELSLPFLIASLVVFVGLITVITLMFSARQVTKGYVLNSLEMKNRELVKESEISDMQISQVRSLSAIENSSHLRGMSRPYTVSYIEGDTAIASR